MPKFTRQLTVFRVEGPTIRDLVTTLRQLEQLFVSKLRDVYGRRVLEYGRV